MTRRARLSGAALVAAVLGPACALEAPVPEGRALEPPPAVREAWADAPPPVFPEPAALAGLPTAPVEGRTGPGDRPFEVLLRTTGGDADVFRRIGAATYEVSLRASGLSRYPCASCHVPGQAAPTPETPGLTTHREIQAVHPAETGATCTTCHIPDAVDRLALPAGGTVELDRAYRLCAQCHYPQVDAWAAGAHGKRLDGWHGRRVVLGCAHCHDPHRPGLEPRIPYPGPTIPGAERLRP